MRVLALDTTTRAGSVALVIGDRIVDERRGDAARTHAERLPAEILAIAEAHGLALDDIDLFAVAAGPGSFTGMRIGIATAQGFAFTTGRPLAAVSALDALAAIGSATVPDGALVAGWIDARRGDVFAALYRVRSAPLYTPERITVIEGPTVGSPDSTLRRWLPSTARERVTFVGDGAVLYSDVLQQSGASTNGTAISAPLLAGAIGRLAAAGARRGEAIAPGAVQPLYVRRPDAEIERERKT